MSEARSDPGWKPSAARAAWWRWPVGLVAALAVTLAVNGVLVYSAIGDPSFVVEPDYHRRAVAFDVEAAAARASRALGWRAEVLPGAGPEGPAVGVTVRLRDAAGAPVAGAEVAVQAFQNARAGRILTATATALPAAPGEYATRIAPDRPGIWVFRIEARRGADRFQGEVRQELVASPRGAP